MHRYLDIYGVPTLTTRSRKKQRRASMLPHVLAASKLELVESVVS